MFAYPPAEMSVTALGADGSGVRAHNVGLLLRSIWGSKEGVSRADLARHAHLSPSTVSDIVGELLQRGLVLESHVARRGSGRPPVVLRFNHDHQRVVGVEIGSSHVSSVLLDLGGRVIASRRADAPVQRDPAGTLAHVVRDVHSLCDEAGIQTRDLLGLGVAVPCPVDDANPGRLSPRILPAWSDIDLSSVLHDALGVPLFVDNDANLGALAEAWWGAGQDVDSLVFVKVATGVGAGVLFDGEIFRGSTGIAGEIGHTMVREDGRPCRCGLTGCLEAEIGSEAVLDRIRKGLDSGRSSRLGALAAPTLADVVAAARAGDPLALDVITDVGHYLGVAVANLLNVLNPARVVLGGQLTEAGEPLLDALRRTVAGRCLSTSIEHADIVLSAIDARPVARGAATLVLRHALQHPDLFQTPAPRAPLT